MLEIKQFKESQFKVGDKVDFMLEDEFRIVGDIELITTYYKQINPDTDKTTGKFGYSDVILNRLYKNKVLTIADNKIFIDGTFYKAIDNAVEVKLDQPIFYHGAQIGRWTFKEGHILKNRVENK